MNGSHPEPTLMVKKIVLTNTSDVRQHRLKKQLYRSTGLFVKKAEDIRTCFINIKS